MFGTYRDEFSNVTFIISVVSVNGKMRHLKRIPCVVIRLPSVRSPAYSNLSIDVTKLITFIIVTFPGFNENLQIQKSGPPPPPLLKLSNFSLFSSCMQLFSADFISNIIRSPICENSRWNCHNAFSYRAHFLRFSLNGSFPSGRL